MTKEQLHKEISTEVEEIESCLIDLERQYISLIGDIGICAEINVPDRETFKVYYEEIARNLQHLRNNIEILIEKIGEQPIGK